ncbi:MAG: hypothetical protein NVSMB26_12510 [Beijerinckiaceae bacterium]
MGLRQANVAAPAKGTRVILALAFAAFVATGLLLRTTPSLGDEHSRRTDPLSTIVNTKLRPDPVPTPDFVKASRPFEELGYLPLQAPEKERAAKRKSPAEVKAMEAELDAAGAANRRRAGRTNLNAPAKRPAKAVPAGSAEAVPIH